MKKRTKPCDKCNREISISNWIKHYNVCDGILFYGSHHPYKNKSNCSKEELLEFSYFAIDWK